MLKVKKNQYLKVLKLAQKVHKALNCKGVTRTDFKFLKQILSFRTKYSTRYDWSFFGSEIANYVGINFSNLVEKILLDASINRWKSFINFFVLILLLTTYQLKIDSNLSNFLR